MAWLTGWLKRKKASIEGTTAGAQTLYQVKAKVHYGTGTDGSPNANDVYLSSSSETNFGDVRWTEDDGSTELEYWIEEKIDSDYAIVWVKIPSIPASPGSTDIYIYYNKSGESTTEDGEETFPEFFDTFPGSELDLDKWDVVAGTPAVSSSLLTIQDGVEKVKTDAAYTFSLNRALRLRGNYSNGGNSQTGFADAFDMSDADNCAILMTAPPNITLRTKEEGSGADDNSDTWTGGSYAIYEIKRIGTTKVRLAIDDVNKILNSDDTKIPTGTYRFGIQCGSGQSIVVDWVLVRNYVEPEPTWGTWYAESKIFQEGYGVSDDLNSYFILDKSFYDPLTDFRVGVAKNVVSFTIPQKEGYVLQRIGDSAKTLSLTGFLLSTEKQPNLRETKRQKLERALKFHDKVKFEIEGEGTFTAVLTSVSFEDVGGEPLAYRYAIEALEVGYSDYADHTNVSHENTSPHTDYSHSDHDDYSDAEHTDHDDHGNVPHENWPDHSEGYSDWGDSRTDCQYHRDAAGHIDASHGDVWTDWQNGECHNDSYTDTPSWTNYGYIDAWVYVDSPGDGETHNDWVDGGKSASHEDYSDWTDIHGNYTDVPHIDVPYDDVAHSDWQDHNNIAHSDWANHSDGYGDWNNHTDSEG